MAFAQVCVIFGAKRKLVCTQHMCAAKLPSISSIDSVMQVGVKC